MSASGRRRSKRSISIDVTSIRFLDEGEMEPLNKRRIVKAIFTTSRHPGSVSGIASKVLQVGI